MTAPGTAISPARLATGELAGFRVLRSLARDDRAEVVLGHLAAPPDDPSGASTVAIKVSASSAEGWRAALHECAALERARGDHVVELRDVDADDTSIRLVFERLARGDLSELLAVRQQVDAGEAVTLLAPVVATLQRLHAAGVAHGRLSARTVLFRDDGTPVLIGFSAAELFEPGAPEVVLEEVGAVRRDRECARSLAVTVLGRVAGSRAHAARALLADVEACDAEFLLPLLATRLFEVAAAVPVRFDADAETATDPAAAHRAVPVREAVAELPSTPSRAAALLGVLVPEPIVQRVLDTASRSPAAPIVARLLQAVAARWRTWSPGRRRAVLAIGAAALTVAAVTALTPGSGSASTASAHGAVKSASPVPSATGGASRGGGSAGRHDPAETADDPVAAAVALLRARERCLGSLSVICLDAVDEAGSGALEDDRAAIRTAQQGGELPDPVAGSGSADSGAPVLVERLGDSALVRLGSAASVDPIVGGTPSPSATGSTAPPSPQRGPASLLLVKGEAGWRIRDVIAAGNGAG